MTDAILDEIYRQRADFAERHDFNVASMFEALYEWQRQSGLEFVSVPPRKPESWQLERARQVLGNTSASSISSTALDKSA